MDRPETLLLTRAEESAMGSCVPADTCIIAVNRQTRRTDEYRPGMMVPATATQSADVYRVPTAAREPAFAVLDAITCTNQAGAAFQSGFCFTCGLRFISPLGLGDMLRKRMAVLGRMPDAVTLDDLYAVMAPAFTAACRRAADHFAGGEVLPYAHWYQELNGGSAFAARLERELLPVFNACGFRLELDSLRITGIAPVPAV